MEAPYPRRLIAEIIHGKAKTDEIKTSIGDDGKVLTMKYVSVSPSGENATPSRLQATGKQLDQLSATELAAFLTGEKFDTVTTETVVALDLSAMQLRQTCLSESVDEILENELGIKSGLMKGKFKSLFTGN